MEHREPRSGRLPRPDRPRASAAVVLGTHPGIDLDAIQAKLVGRQRGGYCYEHALLFGAALEQPGFDVVRRIARVPDVLESPDVILNEEEVDPCA